ncbi:tRNA 2-thiouridine(34) synthase MnmA [Thermodesulfovibrio aggregans]|uniref:tRNA 2-thiouridine(34) synthase MnmA n=1 Tax=Thermodesulfovibrio aggregans TaxID=86166 RepID=UPI0022A9EC9F|nr:tRNA 2-thiouridine(34) synthase MnmA [Thermodesulfovibrio aggregans]
MVHSGTSPKVYNKLYHVEMEKVVVAMSGGVDSSVTAYLLMKKEMAVEGVFFILFDNPPNIELAKKTANFLGIKLHIEDLRDNFKKYVIEPFFDGYRRGITPNPCILCNSYIKFPTLKKIADKIGANYFSTGHYARVIKKNGNYFLLRGLDRNKDQSYFLYGINKLFLSQLILPLGELTKQEVKEIAKQSHIPSKIAEESVEICFLKNRKYYEMFKPATQGPIIEASTGRIIGQHRGIHLFTIGQRKRIGVSSQYPLYVVKIDPSKNAVYVDTKEKVFMKEFYVNELNWLVELEKHKLSCEVKIRYAMKPEKAVVKIVNEKAKVVFESPQFAPTPGQSAVFYSDDIVLGGGVITETVQDF